MGRAAVWPAERMSRGLMREFSRALQDEVERRLAGFISPQNWLRFRHGDRWSIRRVDASEDAEMFRRMQSLLPMSHDDVVRNDLKKLMDTIDAQATTLAQQNVDLLLQKVDEAVKLTGNEVSIDESRPFAEWYLEMLQRSTFFSDKEGKVTPPPITTSPEFGEEIERRFAEQGPAFKLRVREIMFAKAAEAVEAERQRLSRYEGFDEAGE